MTFKNTIDKYGSVAKSFHWLMALLIIGMLAVGLWMTGLEVSPKKFQIYGWHKSIGAIILGLALLRLLWRFNNITPPLPHHMKWYERFGAHSSHLLLYILMLAMPLSGWLMSSASGFPVSVFGLFTLPDLVHPNQEYRHLFKEAHEIFAWALIAVISAHASAALFHHFYFRDTVLKRMLP